MISNEHLKRDNDKLWEKLIVVDQLFLLYRCMQFEKRLVVSCFSCEKKQIYEYRRFNDWLGANEISIMEKDSKHCKSLNLCRFSCILIRVSHFWGCYGFDRDSSSLSCVSGGSSSLTTSKPIITGKENKSLAFAA